MKDMPQTYRAPELCIVTLGNYSTLTVRSEDLSNSVEGTNELLSIGNGQSVLWCFAHGDDKNVAIVAVKG